MGYAADRRVRVADLPKPIAGSGECELPRTGSNHCKRQSSLMLHSFRRGHASRHSADDPPLSSPVAVFVAARERIAGLQAGDRIRKRKTVFGW